METGQGNNPLPKTALVSRIIQRDIGPIISWSFHIADPLDQDTGLTLSSEKLPCAHFEFRGTTATPEIQDILCETHVERRYAPIRRLPKYHLMSIEFGYGVQLRPVSSCILQCGH